MSDSPTTQPTMANKLVAEALGTFLWWLSLYFLFKCFDKFSLFIF